MNSILKFLKEWWMIVALLAIFGSMVGYSVDTIREHKERRRQEAQEIARLEAGYKYTVMHRHAQKYSYASVYYTNSYDTEGQVVKFVDHTGRQRMLSGDISIVENK